VPAFLKLPTCSKWNNKMEKEIDKMCLLYDKYAEQLEKFELKVREVCDFNARITFCAGDGHLILNEENGNVARLNCLTGRTKTNKLTEEQHEEFCI
jgi:hypothetical protein